MVLNSEPTHSLKHVTNSMSNSAHALLYDLSRMYLVNIVKYQNTSWLCDRGRSDTYLPDNLNRGSLTHSRSVTAMLRAIAHTTLMLFSSLFLGYLRKISARLNLIRSWQPCRGCYRFHSNLVSGNFMSHAVLACLGEVTTAATRPFYNNMQGTTLNKY